MSVPPGRQFTFLDAIVLIAATAIGVALSREPWSILAGNWPALIDHGMDHWSIILEVLEEAPAVVEPSLLAWSTAVFLLGLRPPRPRFRRLTRQPGWVACGLSLFPLVVHGVIFLSLLPIRGWPAFFNHSYLLGTWLGVEVGAAVVGAWLVLLFTRRWRAERNWIDRAGRVLGLGWILAFMVASWFFTWDYGGW
jgi:hypothetical protein